MNSDLLSTSLDDCRSANLTIVPPKYSYPREYWFLPIPWKQIKWLLDQNRLDDSVVYTLYAIGPSFPGEIRFLDDHPDRDAIISRLVSEGRIRLYGKNPQHQELVLGPASGIDGILADVEFLSERRHPAY